MGTHVRRQFLVKKGFQTRLTIVILLVVIIVANITGGIVFTIIKTDVGRVSLFSMLNIKSSDELLLPAVARVALCSFCL